jgi:Phage minor capsid protein 2
MLTADYLDALPDPILDLFEEYTQTVINDIARRLAKAGRVTDTAAWQMQRLTESGKVYEAALEEIARVTGQSESALRALFERAGVKAMKFDDAVYKAAGLNPLPLNLSPAMSQVLAAGLQKTNGVMRNLTLTTALSSQEAYIHAADLAYMQITGGAFDYQTALKNAIKQAANQGLMVGYPGGHKDQLDVALRRTILTGVNQTVGRLQETRANEMGADLVQTSAHIGARPTHMTWQGQIFSRSGSHAKYPDFVSSTGYGTGPGLMGYNCRHSWFPFFEGISVEHYKQAELESYENKKVTYNGQELTFYEATQQQRAIERQIRKVKRQAGALEAAGIDNTDERIALGRYQAKMRDFTRQTKLRRQSFREQVYAGPGTNIRRLSKPPAAKTPTAQAAPVSKVPAAKATRVQELAIADQNSPDVVSRVSPGMASIDKVHSVDGMPDYYLSDAQVHPKTKNSEGFYAPDSVTMRNPDGSQKTMDMIGVQAGKVDPSAAFVHEYGHMIDYRGLAQSPDLPASKLAATGEGPLAKWYSAVQKTPEYRRMQDVLANPDAFSRIEIENGERFKVSPNVKVGQYLSDPEELWARSYAQYIGNKTGHDYNPGGSADSFFPSAWSGENFGPVSDAIESVLRRKGWLK